MFQKKVIDTITYVNQLCVPKESYMAFQVYESISLYNLFAHTFNLPYVHRQPAVGDGNNTLAHQPRAPLWIIVEIISISI